MSQAVRRGSRPTVSVIVPSRNSAHHIGPCIESIMKQSVAPLEILVCDKSSCDDTAAIARELGAVVLTAGPERSAQRNAAARRARGDALLFVDCDMRLQPDVIRSCLQQWEAGARIITIPEKVIGGGVWARGRDLEKRLHQGIAGYEAARFVERALFAAAGGYDERMVAGEDFDLHLALVGAGGMEGTSRVPIHHFEDHLSLQDYIRKWRYYGACLGPFIDKRGQARRQLPTLPRIVMRRWRLALGDPVGLIALAVLKLTEFSIIGWQVRARSCRREARR